MPYVFGYSCGLDMTRRDRQFDARDNRLPWEVGKSFDDSAPCGVMTPSSKGHRLSGALALSVNGKERQRGDLSQMIWSQPEIVAQLSRQVTLQPGDLIFTGTPAGVGAVVPGDTIRLDIEGLTPLTIAIGAADEAT